MHEMSEKCRRCECSRTLSCDRRCEKDDNKRGGNNVSYPTCFGKYQYEYTCFRCSCDLRCLEHTKAKEAINMNRNNVRSTESHDERKERLDKEWLKRLPCYTCHSKMQKLCKYYNTFNRPDYNAEQFNVGEITCDDKIEIEKKCQQPPNASYLDEDLDPTIHQLD